MFAFVLGRAVGEAADAAWRTRWRRSGGNDAERVRDVMAKAVDVVMQFRDCASARCSGRRRTAGS